MSALSCAGTAVGLASQDVLVITDLSPASNNAVWRGARIARERGASLRLLHVSAGAKHMAGARQALGSIGRQLHEHLGIELDAQALEGELLPAAISAARAAGLLVIGPRRANPLREWISGTQAERLIRLCRIPTLVVKRPATPGRNATPGPPEHGRYGRVLVSVDLRPEAVDLIAAAMSLSRDPQPQVFHAVVANANGRATAPEALVAHPGETAIQKAQAMLRDFIKSSGAQKLGAVSAVAFGHAARCVLARERATGAELVVIGKRQRGLLADFILGGVTQQVLASSRADVLVMPNRPAPTWQPMAPARPP